MILHCDGNSFFASCEQIYRPDLRGKPVAVLSNNDGIIVALNKEAKAFGLKRGDPYFKVTNICEKNNVTVFSSNYTLYADISRRITSIYLEYAPEIEEYSIDESFLFFNKCNWTNEEYYQIGKELKERIFKEVGIPICVGGAPTKTLAKLYNKKAKEHDGVYIYNESNVDSLLESVDCQTIWGIGRKRAEKLFNNGIKNALQLKNLELDKAKKWLTVQGVATIRELNGISCIDKIERLYSDVITSSRQFGIKVYDIQTLECAVVKYTQAVVEKLRKQKAEANSLSVYLSTCNYYENNPLTQYSNGIFIKLPRETSYTADIVQYAIKGLHKIYREGFGYKTVMISLYGLLPERLQGNLFIDPTNDIKKKNFMKTLDRINSNYGRTTLSLAKGFEKGEHWQTKREKLSPRWTTQIDEIPTIK